MLYLIVSLSFPDLLALSSSVTAQEKNPFFSLITQFTEPSSVCQFFSSKFWIYWPILAKFGSEVEISEMF